MLITVIDHKVENMELKEVNYMNLLYNYEEGFILQFSTENYIQNPIKYAIQ